MDPGRPISGEAHGVQAHSPLRVLLSNVAVEIGRVAPVHAAAEARDVAQRLPVRDRVAVHRLRLDGERQELFGPFVPPRPVLRSGLGGAGARAGRCRPGEGGPGVPDPAPIPMPQTYDQPTALAEAATQAAALGAICDAVEKAGFRAAGTNATEVTEDAVA